MNAYNGMGGAGNGVAQVAAVDFCQSDLMLLREVEEEAGKSLVGVGASHMDVSSVVSALTF